MKDDKVLSITIESVPFGMVVYTPDEELRKSLMAAYHNSGWHLASAQRRAYNGVFYDQPYVSEIIEILSCKEDDEDGFTSAAAAKLVQDTYDNNGSVTLGVPASVAMPLLGLQNWRHLFK